MEQRNIRYPLGAISNIEAETFGEPGKRTFRLALASGAAICYVWLEKEQLFQLGVYLQESIEALSAEGEERESRPTDPEWSGEDTSIEFKARQVFLNLDKVSRSFRIQAYESDEEQEAASVSCWITVPQARALAEESLRICAAGRPPCFLCGLPINPEGHVCPRANGHAVFESG